MQYSLLKDKLNAIPYRRNRVFLKLTYATLGRIGEVVRSRYQPTKNPAITLQQISESTTPKGIPILEIRLLTEKVHLWRTVPLYRTIEPWLSEDIYNYAKANPKLFPYSTVWGEKVFEKWFNTQHIHLLRKWRATHLLTGKVTGKLVPRQVVSRMGGWTDLSSLDKYYDLSITEDYSDAII